MKDGFRGEEFVDGFAPALTPDLIEPAKKELFVLFGSCLCFWSGHGL
jgi:hypothetical protein